MIYCVIVIGSLQSLIIKGKQWVFVIFLMDKYKDELVPFYSGAFDRKNQQRSKRSP